MAPWLMHSASADIELWFKEHQSEDLKLAELYLIRAIQGMPANQEAKKALDLVHNILNKKIQFVWSPAQSLTVWKKLPSTSPRIWR